MKFWENDLNKILFFLLVVLVIFLGFVGYGAYQLKAKNTSGGDSVKTQPENFPTQVDTNRCWQISQLRAENVELKKQLESMKNKIEDEGKTVDDLKGEIAFWFSFGSILVTAITMIVAIIAIVVPLYNMSEIKEKQQEVEEKQKEVEEKQKKFDEKQKEVEADLKSAMNSYNKMKVQIESINKKVAQAKQDAYDAEASAEISRIFYMNDTNGMNEAIKVYEEVIEKYPNYSNIENVYLNLGKLKFDTGEYAVALGYYEKAINKNNANEVFYSNRAKCYRKLAENEQDPAKKADYIAKAEEDKNTAEELKQKGK